MAMIKRIGYGQIEANHLTARFTGEMYAQLPLDESIAQLENGQFVKYDRAAGKVNFTGKGPWLLVNNEIKNYGDYDTTKDFALVRKERDLVGIHGNRGIDLGIYPRVEMVHLGNVYTTNCVGAAAASGHAVYAGIEIAKGDLLKPNDKGFLVVAGDASESDLIMEVTEITTMPDGQIGVKLTRIK